MQHLVVRPPLQFLVFTIRHPRSAIHFLPAIHFSTSRSRDRPHLHPLCARALQHARDFIHRATGRNDVIDDGDMRCRQRSSDREGAANVSTPCALIESCLFQRFARTHEQIGSQRQRHAARDVLRQDDRLIESALAEAPLRERNGNEQFRECVR
jgi:hypothetical protein